MAMAIWIGTILILLGFIFLWNPKDKDGEGSRSTLHEIGWIAMQPLKLLRNRDETPGQAVWRSLKVIVIFAFALVAIVGLTPGLVILYELYRLFSGQATLPDAPVAQ